MSIRRTQISRSERSRGNVDTNDLNSGTTRAWSSSRNSLRPQSRPRSRRCLSSRSRQRCSRSTRILAVHASSSASTIKAMVGGSPSSLTADPVLSDAAPELTCQLFLCLRVEAAIEVVEHDGFAAMFRVNSKSRRTWCRNPGMNLRRSASIASKCSRCSPCMASRTEANSSPRYPSLGLDSCENVERSIQLRDHRLYPARCCAMYWRVNAVVAR